jgi:hypothetical protein
LAVTGVRASGGYSLNQNNLSFSDCPLDCFKFEQRFLSRLIPLVLTFISYNLQEVKLKFTSLSLQRLQLREDTANRMKSFCHEVLLGLIANEKNKNRAE